jgi:hypothetical protein
MKGDSYNPVFPTEHGLHTLTNIPPFHSLKLTLEGNINVTVGEIVDFVQTQYEDKLPGGTIFNAYPWDANRRLAYEQVSCRRHNGTWSPSTLGNVLFFF